MARKRIQELAKALSEIKLQDIEESAKNALFFFIDEIVLVMRKLFFILV